MPLLWEKADPISSFFPAVLGVSSTLGRGRDPPEYTLSFSKLAGRSANIKTLASIESKHLGCARWSSGGHVGCLWDCSVFDLWFLIKSQSYLYDLPWCSILRWLREDSSSDKDNSLIMTMNNAEWMFWASSIRIFWREWLIFSCGFAGFWLFDYEDILD